MTFGEVVVAIPARDLLLVTGSANPGGIRRLREAARELVGRSGHALTAQLFVRRGAALHCCAAGAVGAGRAVGCG